LHLTIFDRPTTPAVFALADGTIFQGVSIGCTGYTNGEVVFNTAMTGYQEVLTDPSYRHQIVTFTYPHIGNTGINNEDGESSKLQLAGLIIRDLPILASNFRSNKALDDYLKESNVVAIAGIDTRKLTRILSEKGVQNGAIVAGELDTSTACAKALNLARHASNLLGMNLVEEVSTKTVYNWHDAEWQLGGNDRDYFETKYPYHVVLLDYGVKFNILRMLVKRGCKVTVLPAQTSADKILALNPDGVFLSNGPGDPGPCDQAISTAKALIEKEIPIFGICFGHQIIALASGAKTVKMKSGHHGVNHPVKDLETEQVLITSQNHNFTVDPTTLPENCRVTHTSLFDNSLQGFSRLDKPVLCFQGHPESSPGPRDMAPLFDKFIHLMSQASSEKEKNA
jgi:carbamoyl-phosphate synthase small subunit